VDHKECRELFNCQTAHTACKFLFAHLQNGMISNLMSLMTSPRNGWWHNAKLKLNYVKYSCCQNCTTSMLLMTSCSCTTAFRHINPNYSNFSLRQSIQFH